MAPYTLRLTGSLIGTQTVALDADLTPLALAVPKLDWLKKAGAAARLELTATLDQDAFTGLDAATVTGPGLDIEGDEADGALVLSRLEIGDTSAYGTIRPPDAPGHPWRVALAGAELDVRPTAGDRPHPP